jgi:hypothetical protein
VRPKGPVAFIFQAQYFRAMEILTEIVIAAPPSTVWRELTDFAKHPEWNPFIKSISGTLKKNERLQVHIAPPGKSGMKFNPKILRVESGKEFAWKGHLFFPGLFDGEHFFRLEDHGNGQTKLIHGEKFSGLLVPLVTGMLTDTKAGFELMNQALKERAERAPGN